MIILIKLRSFLYIVISICLVLPAACQSLIASKTSKLFEDNSSRIINSAALKNWPYINEYPCISADGKYFSYIISNKNRDIKKQLVIKNVDQNEEWQFSDAEALFFTTDNKKFVFKVKDSIGILDLSNQRTSYQVDIREINYPSKMGEWIAWKKKSSNTLIIKNLLSNQEYTFDNVVNFTFSKSAKSVVLQTTSSDTLHLASALLFVDLFTGKTERIWSDEVASESDNTKVNYTLNDNGDRVGFLIKKHSLSSHSIDSFSIWYYDRSDNKLSLISNGLPLAIGRKLSIDDNYLKFSKNEKYLLIRLNKNSNKTLQTTSVNVDVWNYKDEILQSTQLHQLENETYDAVLNISSRNLLQVTNDHEEIYKVQLQNHYTDFVVIKTNNHVKNYWWKLSPKPSYYLMSLIDGSRSMISINANHDDLFSFSPTGNYLVYYDREKKSFYSCNVKLKSINKIGSDIPVEFSNEYGKDRIESAGSPVGIAGWKESDNKILLYDDYDIWIIDLLGKEKSNCITNLYGRKNQIKFRIIEEEKVNIGNLKNGILLTAFNIDNNYNGFYRCSLYASKDPILLYMAPCQLVLFQSQVPDFVGYNIIKPVKAELVDSWVVKRQSFNESPNYYLTHDFRIFKQLTNINPHKDFNWIKPELVKWKLPNGKLGKGLLYKPDNFNPGQKYPVIFHYYQKLAYKQYEYLEPDFSQGDINIPWFVSRGYLVFTPDIEFTIGNTGQSIFNSVISSATYLSRFPYVDSRRLALNGHSFGGYETNYLVSHSKLFAAAVTASGVTDLVSSYLGLAGGAIFKEVSRQNGYEIGQGRLGATLWQKPDLYIQNSPIIKADRIVSPLLIMHNKSDGLVPWSQAVELFTALRRLGKRAWMLQYDNSGHAVVKNDAKDYTIRVEQFYNHYLRNAPVPIWMTQGIPARLKGVITGYDLDPAGNCGKDCKVCKFWNDKWAKDSIATKQLIQTEEKNQ